jgi:uncharacterized protein Veg
MLDCSDFSLKRVTKMRLAAIAEKAERIRINITRFGGRKKKAMRISNLKSPAPTLNFVSGSEIKREMTALLG